MSKTLEVDRVDMEMKGSRRQRFRIGQVGGLEGCFWKVERLGNWSPFWKVWKMESLLEG